MASNSEKPQDNYTRFADSLNDQKLEKLLKNSELIMARPAAILLAQAGIDTSTTEPFQLLDTACGTGVVGSQLQQVVSKSVLEKSKILCGDVNEPFLNFLKQRVQRENWHSTEVMRIDAQNSKLAESSFTHVTISHGLHIIPEPDMVLKDTLKILQPGGRFAFSTMHKGNSAWVPDVRSAFATLPFKVALPDPFPMASNGHLEWSDPETVEKKTREHGFEDIKIETIQHDQHINSAEHFVEAYYMIIDWLVKTYWTEDQKEKYQNSLMERVANHLKEKHGESGWDVTWTMILTTARAPVL